MNVAIPENELPVRLRFECAMTDDELLHFCNENEMVRVEREPNGDLTLMSRAGLEGSNWNSEIITDLTVWARGDGRGKVFDANGGFTLPDGSMRAPDAAWVSWERWNILPHAEQKKFGRISPEFVIELRSESDRLKPLQEKMAGWISNGVEVAWLIDPIRQVVEIYRLGESVEIHEHPTSVQGSGPVRGFELVMSRLW